MAYGGTVELVDGIKPKNNGTWPLVNAHDVYVDDENRLDDALSGIDDKLDGALDNAVRVDKAQTFTDAQKAQARSNISAVELASDLTETGKAADAKVVGDEIENINDGIEAITGNRVISMIKDKVIVNSNETLDPTALIDRPGYHCAILECSSGDVFIINGTGGTTYRLWAFYDSQYSLILPFASSGAIGENLVITAPNNAAYLTINDLTGTGSSYYNELLIDKVEDLKDSIDLVDRSVDTLHGWFESLEPVEGIELISGYYIASAAQVVDLTPIKTASFDNGGYAIVDCQPGDIFTINGTGGASGRLWCFVDSTNTSVLKSDSMAVESNKTLIAPSNSAKLIINSTTNSISFVGKTSSNIVSELNDSFDLSLEFEKCDIYERGAIVTNGDTVDVTSVLISSTPFLHIVITCKADDTFTITGHGGSTYRLWSFWTSGNQKLTRADSNAVEENLVITAPTNAAKIVVNVNSSYEYALYSGEPLKPLVKKSIDSLTGLNTLLGISEITSWVKNKAIAIGTNTNISEQIANPVSTNTFSYAIVPCQFGDKFTVSGNSGTNPKAFCFVNSSYDVLLLGGNASYTNKVIVAPENAAYLIIHKANTNINKSYVGVLNTAALVDNNNLNKIMIGSENMSWTPWFHPACISINRIRNKLYWGFHTTDGYSGIAEYDFVTKQVKKNYLKYGQIDDHNSTAVFIRPDGKIICGYATGHNIDPYMHVRISSVAESIDHFDDDICLASANVTSYCQFFSYNNMLYMFYRSGDYSWAYRTSTDWGLTWSSETIYIVSTMKYYVKPTNVKNSKYLRLTMYSNPNEADPAIRQGFMDLTNGNIYNNDLTTLLGKDHISHTAFQVLIPVNTSYPHQRLFDIAVTDVNKTLILYGPFNYGSDGLYKLYDDGTIIDICAGGVGLIPNSQLGMAWISETDFVVARESNDFDIIEIYSYQNGAITKTDTITSEAHGSIPIRNARPTVDVNGRAFVWQHGYYGSTWTDFNMDIEIHELN